MSPLLNENLTRERIILLLKKNKPLSIDDLSKQLGITPMGIRQHLIYLERKGIVEYVVKRQGVGRPAFLYTLSDKADDLFPKIYPKFIVSAFKDLEKNDGRNRIDDIFRWRKERLLKERRDALADKKSLRDRVHGLRNILESEGYFVELDENNNSYSLKQFNCPISKVAAEFKEACKYELQIYIELLKREITRQQCISEGDISCTYLIPKMQ